MKNKRTLLLLACVSIAVSAADSQDDYRNPRSPHREAKRGDWHFEKGKAHCVSDPELYIKYKNHGPIISWDFDPFKNCEISTIFSPQNCQRVVLTLNSEEGHVFRISLTDNAKKWSQTRIYGWEGPSKLKKEFPKIIFAKKGVPTIDELNGTDVPFMLSVSGSTVKVQIGSYSTTIETPAAARAKNQFTISFASGECTLAPVNVKIVE